MGKFATNSKAEEGRARKAAKKEREKEEAERKIREKEDKEWAKGVKQKSAKQVKDEERQQQKLEAKRERLKLEASEAAELSQYKSSIPVKNHHGGKAKPSITKSTNQDTMDTKLASLSFNHTSTSSTGGNSVASEAYSSSALPVYSASNIDDALTLLGGITETPTIGAVERHPERRVKAAYAAFEEREMPALRAENPTLRLSQLKERLHRMWQKSPDNPFNQASISSRATKEEEQTFLEERLQSDLERFRLPPS